jgi:sec-independent protein translocase protein TatA
MFEGIGLPEILLILVIVFIFFGAGKLPDVATGLGKAIKNFKKAQRGDFDNEDKKEGAEPVATPVKQAIAQQETSETARKAI